MSARLVLGTMNFGQRTPEGESRAILEHAYRQGIREFDTANLYSDGDSERIVGRFLASLGGTGEDAARCRVASKVGLAPIGGRPEGLSRAAIIAGCERSLERLGLTTIDLYYLHAPDPHTPIDESLEALAVLRERGLIAGWGVSNHASWQVLELIHAAPRYALPPPAASQVIHNLLVRQIEIEHLAFAQRYQVEVITYNPLAGGLLADHHDLASGARGAPPAGSRFGRNKLYQRRYWTEQSFRSAEAYRSLAAEHRLTLLELAYRFASQAPGVAAVLIGPASTAHLEAALEACNGPLAGELTAQLARLHTSLAGTDARYAR